MNASVSALARTALAVLAQGAVAPMSTSGRVAVVIAKAFPRCVLAASLLIAGSNALAADALFADGFELGDIELPFGSTNRTLSVTFEPADASADLVLSMDTTGSMTGEISNLKANFLGSVVPSTRALIPDTAYGVASWQDFPVAPFGEAGDVPWRLLQPVTTDTTSAQNGLNQWAAAGGLDVPESGYEALYQAGAGTGVNYPGGFVLPYSGSGLGGVGFRSSGALRILMHVTDAPSHTDTDYAASIPEAHSKSEALTALAALGVRVVPLLSSTDASADAQLQEIAVSTGAEVPPCGFQSVAGCASGQCCTGINGAGEAPAGNGQCPLRFLIPSTGAGADAVLAIGMRAAVKYARHEVISGASDDGSGATLDTTCFVERIEAVAFERPLQEPEASCVPEATPVDVGGVGYNNGFTNFATASVGGIPGSALRYLVRMGNMCAPATGSPQVFVVNLTITDTVTGAVMATRAVRVVVR